MYQTTGLSGFVYEQDFTNLRSLLRRRLGSSLRKREKGAREGDTRGVTVTRASFFLRPILPSLVSKRLPRRLEFPSFSFTTRYNSFFFRPSNSSLAKDIRHFPFTQNVLFEFQQLPVANGTASSKISKTEDNLARYTQIFD